MTFWDRRRLFFTNIKKELIYVCTYPYYKFVYPILGYIRFKHSTKSDVNSTLIYTTREEENNNILTNYCYISGFSPYNTIYMENPYRDIYNTLYFKVKFGDLTENYQDYIYKIYLEDDISDFLDKLHSTSYINGFYVNGTVYSGNNFTIYYESSTDKYYINININKNTGNYRYSNQLRFDRFDSSTNTFYSSYSDRYGNYIEDLDNLILKKYGPDKDYRHTDNIDARVEGNIKKLSGYIEPNYVKYYELTDDNKDFTGIDLYSPYPSDWERFKEEHHVDKPIVHGVFRDLPKLKSIYIGSTVNDINVLYTFYGIPNHPRYALNVDGTINTTLYDGKYKFDNCNKIIVDNANNNYSSIDNSLLDKTGTTLLYSTTSRSISSSIPDTISEIGKIALAYRNFNGSNIDLTIPDNITKIGEYAFVGDYNIKTLHLNKNISTVNTGAFWGCAIETLYFNAPISYMWGSKYYNATLEEGSDGLLVPSSYDHDIRQITKDTLQTVYAGTNNQDTSIRSIGFEIFSGCSNLSNVIIGDYINIINPRAFRNCDISNLEISDAGVTRGIFSSSVNSLNELTIHDDAFNSNSLSDNLRISDRVISLSRGCFANNKNLHTVTFGINLNSVPSSSLSNNSEKYSGIHINSYNAESANLYNYSISSSISTNELYRNSTAEKAVYKSFIRIGYNSYPYRPSSSYIEVKKENNYFKIYLYFKSGESSYKRYVYYTITSATMSSSFSANSTYSSSSFSAAYSAASGIASRLFVIGGYIFFLSSNGNIFRKNFDSSSYTALSGTYQIQSGTQLKNLYILNNSSTIFENMNIYELYINSKLNFNFNGEEFYKTLNKLVFNNLTGSQCESVSSYQFNYSAPYPGYKYLKSVYLGGDNNSDHDNKNKYTCMKSINNYTFTSLQLDVFDTGNSDFIINFNRSLINSSVKDFYVNSNITSNLTSYGQWNVNNLYILRSLIKPASLALAADKIIFEKDCKAIPSQFLYTSSTAMKNSEIVVNGAKIIYIGNNAFSGINSNYRNLNTYANRVLINQNLVKIDQYAFRYSNITSVNTSVNFIEQGAFEGSNVTTVTLNNVIKIGPAAFRNCTSLTTVVINFADNTTLNEYGFVTDNEVFKPPLMSVTPGIDYEAFKGCTNLVSVTINGPAKYIDHDAFLGCTKLSNVSNNANIKWIGAYVFNGCSSLYNIPFSKHIGRDAITGTGFANTNRVIDEEYKFPVAGPTVSNLPGIPAGTGAELYGMIQAYSNLVLSEVNLTPPDGYKYLAVGGTFNYQGWGAYLNHYVYDYGTHSGGSIFKTYYANRDSSAYSQYYNMFDQLVGNKFRVTELVLNGVLIDSGKLELIGSENITIPDTLYRYVFVYPIATSYHLAGGSGPNGLPNLLNVYTSDDPNDPNTQWHQSDWYGSASMDILFLTYTVEPNYLDISGTKKIVFNIKSNFDSYSGNYSSTTLSHSKSYGFKIKTIAYYFDIVDNPSDPFNPTFNYVTKEIGSYDSSIGYTIEARNSKFIIADTYSNGCRVDPGENTISAQYNTKYMGDCSLDLNTIVKPSLDKNTVEYIGNVTGVAHYITEYDTGQKKYLLYGNWTSLDLDNYDLYSTTVTVSSSVSTSLPYIYNTIFEGNYSKTINIPNVKAICDGFNSQRNSTFNISNSLKYIGKNNYMTTDNLYSIKFINSSCNIYYNGDIPSSLEYMFSSIYGDINIPLGVKIMGRNFPGIDYTCTYVDRQHIRDIVFTNMGTNNYYIERCIKYKKDIEYRKDSYNP